MNNKIHVTILILATIFSITALSTSAEAQTVENPYLCNTAFGSTTCAGDTVVCGTSGTPTEGSASCSDPAFLENQTQNIRNNNQANGAGGLILNCYAGSDTQNACVPGGVSCRPDSSCNSLNAATICSNWVENSSGSSNTDAFQCSQGNNGCATGFVQCAFNDNAGEAVQGSSDPTFRDTSLDDDFASGPTGMCDTETNVRQYPGDDSSGTKYNTNLASSDNAIVVDNSCSPACQSGYFNNDGDVANGCEVQNTAQCYNDEGVEGTWQCSGDQMNAGSCSCVQDASPFITGNKSGYATDNPLLWGMQFGLGNLLQIQSEAGAIIADNEGNLGITGDLYYNIDIDNVTHMDNGTQVNFTNDTYVNKSLDLEDLLEAGKNKSFEKNNSLVRGYQAGTGDLLELESTTGTFTIYRNGTIGFEPGPGAPPGVNPVNPVSLEEFFRGGYQNQVTTEARVAMLQGNQTGEGELFDMLSDQYGGRIIGLRDGSMLFLNEDNGDGTVICPGFNCNNTYIDEILQNVTNNITSIENITTIENITNDIVNNITEDTNFSKLFEAGENKQFSTNNALVTAEQTGSGDLLRLTSPEGTFRIYRNGSITFDDGGGAEPIVSPLADVLDQGNVANQDIDLNNNNLLRVGSINSDTARFTGGNVDTSESGTPIATFERGSGGSNAISIYADASGNYIVAEDSASNAKPLRLKTNQGQNIILQADGEINAASNNIINVDELTANTLCLGADCRSNWADFTQSLSDVLAEGNTADRNINLDGNNLENVETITSSTGTGSGTLDVNANRVDINSPLNLEGNQITGVSQILTGDVVGTDVIGTNNIEENAIETGELANYSVHNINLDQNSVDSGKIIDGSIQPEDLKGSPICPGNSFLKFDASGNFFCTEPDSVLSGGNGVTINSNDVNVDAPACSSGEALTWDGSSFTCTESSSQTLSAGDGISINGDEIGVRAGLGLNHTSDGKGLKLANAMINTCPPDQVVKGIGSYGDVQCGQPPINAHCGVAARNYDSGESEYDGEFCASGRLEEADIGDSEPPFPSGFDRSWTCEGLNGGSDTTCTASKEASSIPGSCGPAARGYEYWETSYDGDYCDAGDESPSNREFPPEGETRSWLCEGTNGASDASCTASRATHP